MSECARLSERMPEVALARSIWAPEEADHLRGCPACQAEWALVQLSNTLGREVEAELDVAAAGRAVLLRLAQGAEEARLRKRAWSFAIVSGAAAAAVMLWAGQAAPDPVPASRHPAVATLEFPLPELDNLMPAELNAVLQAMDELNVGDPISDTASGDLDDADLENGFDTWEG